jgi:Ni/Co efflux regulator RcnB
VKTLRNLCLALVAISFLAMPAVAQKGEKGERNNNGATKQRGQARAEEVQNANKKGENTKSKGSQNDGKHKHKGWFKKGEHKAKGHS